MTSYSYQANNSSFYNMSCRHWVEFSSSCAGPKTHEFIKNLLQSTSYKAPITTALTTIASYTAELATTFSVSYAGILLLEKLMKMPQSNTLTYAIYATGLSLNRSIIHPRINIYIEHLFNFLDCTKPLIQTAKKITCYITETATTCGVFYAGLILTEKLMKVTESKAVTQVFSFGVRNLSLATAFALTNHVIAPTIYYFMDNHYKTWAETYQEFQNAMPLHLEQFINNYGVTTSMSCYLINLASKIVPIFAANALTSYILNAYH